MNPLQNPFTKDVVERTEIQKANDPLYEYHLFIKAGWAGLLVGIITVIITALFSFSTLSLWLGGAEATGTIIGFNNNCPTPNHPCSTYDIVDYTASNGQSYTVQIESFFPGNEGQKISLYYDRNNPNNATSANYLVFAEMLFFWLLGIALFAGGIYAFMRARKAHH
jgi:hypothetical protein